jgi:hypothetical protein
MAVPFSSVTPDPEMAPRLDADAHPMEAMCATCGTHWGLHTGDLCPTPGRTQRFVLKEPPKPTEAPFDHEAAMKAVRDISRGA